jgi:signal transduction histidine kinase
VTQSSKTAEGTSREALLDMLAERDRELAQAHEQQAAIAEILDIINHQAGIAQPVFEKLLEKATQLCEAKFGIMNLQSDGMVRQVAFYNLPPSYTTRWWDRPYRPHPESVMGTVGRLRQPIYVDDLRTRPAYLAGDPAVVDLSDLAGARSYIGVPMLRDHELIGMISIFHQEVRPFSENQIMLVRNFAQHAVTAVYNAQLFRQVQTRTRELQAKTRDLEESLQFQTAASDVLKVISRSPDVLQPVLDAIVETSRDLCDSDGASIFLLRDGKFHFTAVAGAVPKHLEYIRANPAPNDGPVSAFTRAFELKRTVHYPNVAEDPDLNQGHDVLGGPRALLVAPLMRDGEVLGVIILRQSHLKPFTPRQIQATEMFADQAVIAISNVNLFNEVQQRTRELAKSLEDLRAAQDRLVQTEKLASLGQLTAGIAHEIKNPLNFVNNFSALSAELVGEMKDALSDIDLDKNKRDELDEIAQLLKSNLEKVVQHGKRADSIVKNMLLHSRQGSGEHRRVDINTIVDEALNLAYHGARAEKTEFNITLQRNFDPAVGMADGYPQEITRVLLNLISNGFYAATKRKADADDGFEPTLTATTKNLGDKVEIRIRDNGAGIPTEIKEKIFNPFFTTKPAGEGTGLGLSMSHDIIVKQHGGTIDVDTAPGVFTEFKIVLSRAGASIIKPGEHS